MNLKLKKLFVVLVSVLTFGLVTPSYAHNLEHGELDKDKKPDTFAEDKTEAADIIEPFNDTPLQKLIRQGKEVSFYKFGEKIGPVIEDEFQTVIIPNIESVIEEISKDLGDKDFSNIEISEHPGKGTSEKMFHVINSTTRKDLIRFHVRRDHPPGEGYWFNFHYHSYVDNFEAHYDLGSIYWDTNTPPNWMKTTKKHYIH